MGSRAHFSPKLFTFLEELERNNRREWFEKQKPRFIAEVRDPLLTFISDFAPRLSAISPQFVADPRPVGGSMFRLHRDVRFSKDKSPYKTHVAAQFRHARGKDVHAPGFYLHIESGGVFGGAGIWRPDGTALGRIRQAIMDDPATWKRINQASGLKSLERHGESLKRPPRGIDPDHPLIEDLKRKDHVVTFTFSKTAACKPGFLADYAKSCRSASRYVRFLTEAVGLEF